MTAEERKRLARRRRIKGTIRKNVTNLMFMPARMPKLNGYVIAYVTRMCEIAGLVFVGLLFLHLIRPEIVNVVFVIASAGLFIALLGVIKLGDYQERLGELLEYYGVKI